jgi:hypothetical protein
MLAQAQAKGLQGQGHGMVHGVSPVHFVSKDGRHQEAPLLKALSIIMDQNSKEDGDMEE